MGQGVGGGRRLHRCYDKYVSRCHDRCTSVYCSGQWTGLGVRGGGVAANGAGCGSSRLRANDTNLFLNWSIRTKMLNPPRLRRRDRPVLFAIGDVSPQLAGAIVASLLLRHLQTHQVSVRRRASAVALPARVCRSSRAVGGGVVQKLSFAGSSSGTSRLVAGSGSGSTPSYGASRYVVAGESRASAALVARRVETSDEIRGTIGVAFTASTTEAPAAPGGAWASATRAMCGALDAGTILTATRAPA